MVEGGGTLPVDFESDKQCIVDREINFKKIDGRTEIGLEGSEFVVYKEVDGVKLYLAKDLAGMISWSIDKAVAFKFVSEANGRFKIEGLDDGSYFLEETKAPIVNGKVYSLLEAPVDFVINGKSQGGNLNIENKLASSVPKTAGTDTVLFKVMGLGLMVMAAKTNKRGRKK